MAPSDTSQPLLEVDHVTMQFGGLVALNDVSFQIRTGEILGLIGPNGAGKTTCFNVMTGVYQATKGEVRFNGEKLANHDIPRDAALDIATRMRWRLEREAVIQRGLPVRVLFHAFAIFAREVRIDSQRHDRLREQGVGGRQRGGQGCDQAG